MTQSIVLPPLGLERWRPTRDILWRYARCLGGIRGALSQPARHWSHISLAVGTRGITTGPMMVAGERFEIRLEIQRAQIVFDSESGQAWVGGLPGTSSQEILERANGWMTRSGGVTPLKLDLPDIGDVNGYEQAAADSFWSALSRIDAILGEFASGLRGETLGPQLWPHHFDLAVLWLSGRQAPGEDPEDEEAADESMNFGFSTGDEGIPNPYFYATAYPALEELSKLELPKGGRWHAEGWQGARLDYADLAAAEDPGMRLQSFFTTVQQAGARAMGERALGK